MQVDRGIITAGKQLVGWAERVSNRGTEWFVVDRRTEDLQRSEAFVMPGRVQRGLYIRDNAPLPRQFFMSFFFLSVWFRKIRL